MKLHNNCVFITFYKAVNKYSAPQVVVRRILYEHVVYVLLLDPPASSCCLSDVTHCSPYTFRSVYRLSTARCFLSDVTHCSPYTLRSVYLFVHSTVRCCLSDVTHCSPYTLRFVDSTLCSSTRPPGTPLLCWLF